MTRIRFFASIYALTIFLSVNIFAMTRWQPRQGAFSLQRSDITTLRATLSENAVSPTGVVDLVKKMSVSPAGDDDLEVLPVLFPNRPVPSPHVVRSEPSSPGRKGGLPSSLPTTPERCLNPLSIDEGDACDAGRSCDVFGQCVDIDMSPSSEGLRAGGSPLTELLSSRSWGDILAVAAGLRQACGAIETIAMLQKVIAPYPDISVTQELIYFFNHFESAFRIGDDHCYFLKNMIHFRAQFEKIKGKVAGLSYGISTDEIYVFYTDYFDKQSLLFADYMEKVSRGLDGTKRANSSDGAVLGNPAMLS